eukprot:UN22615
MAQKDDIKALKGRDNHILAISTSKDTSFEIQLIFENFTNLILQKFFFLMSKKPLHMHYEISTILHGHN